MKKLVFSFIKKIKGLHYSFLLIIWPKVLCIPRSWHWFVIKLLWFVGPRSYDFYYDVGSFLVRPKYSSVDLFSISQNLS